MDSGPGVASAPDSEHSHHAAHRTSDIGDLEETQHLRSTDNTASVPVPSLRLMRSQVAKPDYALCLFCKQQLKRVGRTRQGLSRCMSFEACDTLYRTACVREDEDVLLEVQPGPGQPDLIAKEVRYHHACYAKYINPKTLDSISEEKVMGESGGHSGSGY